MDSRLSEQIENQRTLAREDVRQEWVMFEIAERDGYFSATQAAETARLLAMTLQRVDQMDQRQGRVVLYLKVIAACLILITIILGGASIAS